MTNKKLGNDIEVWADVEGYEGSYRISSLGRVVSLKRGEHHILKSCVNSRGYVYVDLSKNGKRKSFRVSVLVATHFLPKPIGIVEVNHKDENKLNNRVDNLEWCTKSYNVNYGTRIERQRVKICKPVIQYSKTGEYIDSYESITKASEIVGISKSHIVRCCQRLKSHAGGFIWRYATEVNNGTHE